MKHISKLTTKSKPQKQKDISELLRWLRGIEFHDEDEDGIGEIELFFKIRDEDERMRHIYKTLRKRDVINILSDFVARNCSPCEDFDNDWRGRGIWGHAGFDVCWQWDYCHQGIILRASFRT